MKKYILLLYLILLIGCTDIMNTPIKQIELYFSKYQTLDKDVINELNNLVDLDDTMNNDQKERYKQLMKHQYYNLSYDIKDTKIDGDEAISEIEITVINYSKAIASSNLYLSEYPLEFMVGNILDQNKYLDYKIKKMEEENEKVTYTLNIKTVKIDDKWKLEPLTNIDKEKISGIYIK